MATQKNVDIMQIPTQEYPLGFSHGNSIWL